MPRLSGKTALITGSTQGIGAACALRMASEGARVALNGRHRDARAEALLADIAAAGGTATFIEADVGSAQGAIGLVGQAVLALGRLDILVNNAGLERRASFWEVSEEDYDAVMDVNLKGVFFGTQAFVRHCRATGRPGAVVNMSSVHEEIAFPHFAAYCASKGALRMLTRNLATELAPLGIRINNVAPGAIATPINAKLMSDAAQLAKVTGNIPMQRMGTPEEVAAVVAFLASDEAAYVSGSTYAVDGGLTFSYTEQ